MKLVLPRSALLAMPPAVMMKTAAVTAVRMTMFDAPAKGAARAAQAAIPFKQFRVPRTDGAASACIGARMFEFSGGR